MMHYCVFAMSFFWNRILIWYLDLWYSNQVNGKLLLLCLLFLLTVTMLIFLKLPSWWGKLLSHNGEFFYQLLYIFSVFRWEDRFVALIICPLVFGPIIWNLQFLWCMMGGVADTYAWSPTHIMA